MTASLASNRMPPTAVSPLRLLLDKDDASIGECLIARAKLESGRVFLQHEHDSWTYEAGLEAVRGFAGFLVSRGLDRGSHVASYLSNRPECLWAWFGTVWLGGVYVPLNRQHKGEVLADMIRRSRASCLVTEVSALETLEALGDLRGLGVETLVVCGDSTSSHGGAHRPFPGVSEFEHPALAETDPCDPAGILFTSGTTGRSKAAVIPHNQYCRGAARLIEGYGLRAGDVFHEWLPLYHLAGQLHMTMAAVICGGTVALFPTFSATQFRQQVTTSRATVICGVAAIVEWLMALPPDDWDSDNTLRVGIIGGIPAELHRPFEERFRIRLGENYGMTECDPVTYPRPEFEAPPGSCGIAGEDFELRILDESGSRALPEAVGEIAVRPQAEGVMMLGYETTAGTESPFNDYGWFHCGDLGRMDESGFLYYQGRKGDYIRRRGENISCAELESIVVSHPHVIECAAVGMPSPDGEDEVKLALVSDIALDLGALADWCDERMAGFMVPRYFERVDHLPKSNLGKVLKSELQKRTGHEWDRQSVNLGDGV